MTCSRSDVSSKTHRFARTVALLFKSRTKFRHDDGRRRAQPCEAIEDRGMHLQLGNLAVEVTRRYRCPSSLK